MTSSIVCHRFVQNAWKKDLCSNCFKSREEHVSLKREAPVSRRPLAVSKTRGILKKSTGAGRRKRTVSFKPELAEVIGYGGGDWSDTDDIEIVEDSSPESSEDDAPVDNDNKDLEKLTKCNTEQNANIPTTTTTDRRRTFTQLMLGQPQKDSEGKKQTLLVSVTPFGKDTEPDRTPARKFTKSVSHIPIAKNNKEVLVEAKPKVVLTSYSKNRDSPELQKTSIDKKDTEDTLIVVQNIEEESPKIVQDVPAIVLDTVTVQEPAIVVPEPAILVQENVFVDDDDENDEKCEKNSVVETIRNDLSTVQQKVEVLSVPTIERKLAEPEIIVKSELTVQLLSATPPCDPYIDVPKESEFSEDSADSLGPSESREQAGEPDGRADPDVLCEPPALPRSPPPLLTSPPRNSFLHGSPSPRLIDKPKVPSKPDKIIQMVRKPPPDLTPAAPLTPCQVATPIIDPSKLPNKRRAPNPPIEELDPIDPEPEFVQMPRSASMPESEIIAAVLESNPEPIARRVMSNDNLLLTEKIEEKRKDKSRTRFSLKKFLRVGSGGGKISEKHKTEEIKEKIVPLPKPRLVIVHPLEMNGAEVAVPSVGIEEQATHQHRGLPPAPPPRNFSEKRYEEPKPPPKSEELLQKQYQMSTSPSKSNNGESVYANLGEFRSGLVPCKPQRTASMREREEQQNKRLKQQQLQHEHVYERITPRRHSDEANKSPNKSVSLPAYSGSEPDLELYSPCGSYYGSECEISEGGCSRPCRLRSRKGRSIVHRNLEDNYGAVVVANHEALAQVLENLNQSPAVQPALRGLQSAPVLRWTDFSIVESAPGVIVGRRIFFHALWGAHHITLSLAKEQGSMHKHPVALSSFTLVPVTEFNDLVPVKYLPGNGQCSEHNLVQATVTILPWMQIETIQGIGAMLKTKNGLQLGETNRDALFILLQFVNSLKSLQAQGIEELPLSLSNFILCHDIDRDTYHRLYVLSVLSEDASRTEDNEKLGSLCQCAMIALNELSAATKLATLIRILLKKESAMSLSQVKSILEFSLWGPSDVAQGVPIKDRELALQRWLDLERATVLHGLVGTRVQLSVLEECHLLFLVRSSAKMMCEASLLLETNGAT